MPETIIKPSARETCTRLAPSIRPWQLLAIVSGSIFTVIMAAASISYTTTLASPDRAFTWLPISNQLLFALLALAFDLGMIASVFGAAAWWPSHRVAALTCCALFVIASLFSVHAVRGYIALNLTKASAPAERSADLYSSLKLELEQAQAHLGHSRSKYQTAARRERRRLERQITEARVTVQATRTQLAQVAMPAHVSPLSGHEWQLALMLWFFNATCWFAWFGRSAQRTYRVQDTVTTWLSGYDQSKPQHCASVFEAYSTWCADNRQTPLAQYSFYTRLIELGAHKYRDGRNGPTMYALPHRVARGGGHGA